MANASDIANVRKNANESDSDLFTDDDIGTLIDIDGVAGATATVWRQKAAHYASLVNVSESGASHSYSDLHRAALNMAKEWDAQNVIEDLVVSQPTSPVVRRIVRS